MKRLVPRRNARLLAGALAFSLLAFSLVKADVTVTLDPPALDFKDVGPYINPAPVGMSQKGFELYLVIDRQRHVNPVDLARARAEDTMPDPYQFADVLGEWFKKGNPNLVHTDALLKAAMDMTESFVGPAKEYWHRNRPCFQDPADVEFLPSGGDEEKDRLRKSGSFPSGHSADGTMFALVLSDITPASYREKLIARGVQFGDDRVLLGVHFPSDVVAGRWLAEKVYAGIKDEPAYKAAVVAARAEITAQLSLSPSD